MSGFERLDGEKPAGAEQKPAVDAHSLTSTQTNRETMIFYVIISLHPWHA